MPQSYGEGGKSIITTLTFVMCLTTDAIKGKPEMILQTGCSDCMVLKSDDDLPLLILLSKRGKKDFFFLSMGE